MFPYNLNPPGVEARRLLGVAEKLLETRDLAGSKAYATRARESDPRLEQAEQIIAIVDTVVAGEKRITNQHLDWYAILQLDRRTSDSELIASQYRRLALLLNPSRNNFPFADHAYKLISEAWLILSNPSRKFQLDNEIGGSSSNQTHFNFIQHYEPPPVQQQHNGTTQFNFIQEHSEELHQSSEMQQEQQQFLQPFAHQQLFPQQPVHFLNEQQQEQRQSVSHQQHWSNQTQQQTLPRSQPQQPPFMQPQSIPEQPIHWSQSQQPPFTQPQSTREQPVHWSQPQQPLPWPQHQTQQPWQQPQPQQPLPWHHPQLQQPSAPAQPQQHWARSASPPQPQQLLPQAQSTSAQRQPQQPLARHHPQQPWARSKSPPQPQQLLPQPQQTLPKLEPQSQRPSAQHHPQQPWARSESPSQPEQIPPQPRPTLLKNQIQSQKTSARHQPQQPWVRSPSPSPPPPQAQQLLPQLLLQAQQLLPEHQPQAQQPLPLHQSSARVQPQAARSALSQQLQPSTRPQPPKPEPKHQPPKPEPKHQPPKPEQSLLQQQPPFPQSQQPLLQHQPPQPQPLQPSMRPQSQKPEPQYQPPPQPQRPLLQQQPPSPHPQQPLLQQQPPSPQPQPQAQQSIPKPQVHQPLPKRLSQPPLPGPQELQTSPEPQSQPQSQLKPQSQSQPNRPPAYSLGQEEEEEEEEEDGRSEMLEEYASSQQQEQNEMSQEPEVNGRQINGGESGDKEDGNPENNVNVEKSSCFWTGCPYCYNMYEYPSAYAECTLRCQNCRRAFHAFRISTPPMAAEKDAHFYCWGFFPFSVSTPYMEKNKAGASNWTPFSTIFALPRGGNGWNFGKRKNTGPRIYFDDDQDSFLDISSNEDSDEDWHITKKKKVGSPRSKVSTARNVKKPKVDKRKKVQGSKVGNSQASVVAQEGVSISVPNMGVPSVQVGETSNEAASVTTRKQPGRVARSKLDLNVEFSNEAEEPARGTSGANKAGNGLEENVEGNGFFEGLDEFLNSLPILSVVGDDDKVKTGEGRKEDKERSRYCLYKNSSFGSQAGFALVKTDEPNENETLGHEESHKHETEQYSILSEVPVPFDSQNTNILYNARLSLNAVTVPLISRIEHYIRISV